MNKFKEINIKGDGHCFFRSVANGLIRQRDNRLDSSREYKIAIKLRKIVASLLRNRNFVNQTFNGITLKDIIESEGISVSKYANDISKNKYGGEIEAFIISKYYNITIVIHFYNKSTKKYEKTVYGNNRRIIINLLGYFYSHEAGNHYNLLVKQKD